MGNLQSPGLYPEERSASAGPVAAASTSTYATAGWLQKGPVNQPQLVTSFANFVEKFGSYWRNSYVPFIMSSFFNNEGALAYVTRVVPADAAEAVNSSCPGSAATKATYYTRVLTDPVTTLDATHFNTGLAIDGAAAADVDVTGDSGVAGSYALSALASTLDAVPGISASVETTLGGGNRIKVETDTAGLTGSLGLSTATANDCSAEFLGLDLSGGAVTITGEDSIDWGLEARWPGSAYNLHRCCISGNEDDAVATGGWTSFNVEFQEESASGEADWTTNESWDAVVFDDDTSEQFAPDVINDQTNFIKIVEGTNVGTPRELTSKQQTNECMGEGTGAITTFSGTLLYGVVEETLTVTAGSVTGVDDGDGNITGTGIDSGSINYDTGVWTITFSAAVSSGDLIAATYNTLPDSELCCTLSGGTDGTGPITRTLISDPALEATKEGIYSFNDIEDILNISLPDFAGDQTVSGDLIAYAEGRKDRMVILTTAVGTSVLDAVKFVRKTAQYNTSYAALYYPWVTIADPLTTDNRPLNVPPDGFIAGVYARTDTDKNVGKAPAGITDGRMVGAIGLERVLSKGERDVLYPARINPIVSSPQTGIAVWGARTLSKDAEWLYVNVRRLFMFCEKSITNASYWVVFENNGPATWSRMKAQGDGFFLTIFRDGYLKGTTPSEAYKIVIDESNNPTENIDAGILTADYYLAANKPAEFVRLRFQQKVQSA